MTQVFPAGPSRPPPLASGRPLVLQNKQVQHEALYNLISLNELYPVVDILSLIGNVHQQKQVDDLAL